MFCSEMEPAPYCLNRVKTMNYGILDYKHEIDGSGGEFLYMPAGGSLNPPSHETVDKKMHYVHQEGQPVFKYAVRKMGEISRDNTRAELAYWERC